MIAGLLFAAVSMIGQMEDAGRSVALRNDACVGLRGDRSAAAVQAMVRALSDAAVRACAARNLREAEARAELRAALRSEDADVRAAAAHELGLLRDTGAVPALTRAAEDANLLVSAAAIRALAATGGAESLDALLAVARKGGIAGFTALQSLSAFQSPAVLSVARQYAVSGDLPAQVLAIGIVAAQGSAEDVPLLEKLAASREPMEARGRGFGFMPPVDLGRVATQAAEEIRSRNR